MVTQAIIDGDRSHFINETAVTERLRMYMKSHNYSLAEAEPEFYTFVRSLSSIPPKEFGAEFLNLFIVDMLGSGCIVKC